MSFFAKKHKDKFQKKEVTVKEVKEKDGGQKSQFYVEFLGWMECRGVRGRRYTDPAVQELKRRQKKMDSPPKLTIQLTAWQLKISQDFEEKKQKGKGSGGGGGGGNIKKVTFPPIPAQDVTYVVQATRESDQRLDDVVACIFLGYMPRTGRYVHVHVYRFDEPSTASTFAKLMGGLVANNLNRINEVERDLAEKGEIDDPGFAVSASLASSSSSSAPPRLSDGGFSEEHDRATTGTDSAAGSVSGSGGYSGDEYGGRRGAGSSSPTFGSDDMDADLQSLNDVQPFDSVAEELKYRLRMGDMPLLLPPKDYDTISRARGNLLDINERRCMALNVVGEGAHEQQRPRNGSEESGIDLASPGSDGGDVLSRFPPSATATTAAHGGPDMTQHQQNPPPPPPQHGMDNDYVYPPRQDRGGVYPPRSPAMSPALHRAAAQRHSPQSSPYGTRSSRTSHHSSHSNGSGERFPIYSRSNSSSSNPQLSQPQPPVPVNVVEHLQNDDFMPPTDYDEDSFEPAAMRRPQQQQYPLDPRPHSGTPLGGSPMLMRSLPAKVMQSELALNSPRNPRRALDGDEYFFNAQRRSQPVYASHNGLDKRPRSSEVGSAPRRVNSYR